MKRIILSILCIALAVVAVVFGIKCNNENVQLQQTLDIELAATPTATADISSMLAGGSVSSAYPSSTSLLLKTGSKGDLVKEIQKRLKELGYYSGDTDGQFGQATANAVICFQEQLGLTADGIVGESTYQVLCSASAPTFAPTPTPTPAAYALLKKGSKGDAVKTMQQKLKDLGYYSGEVDGYFGSATEEALRTFQRQNGLDVDGVAASKTFAVLYSEAAPTVAITPTPDPNAMPILVNRTHPIAEDYRPSDMVKLKNVLSSSLVKVKGSEIEGCRIAVEALETMLEAAQADGLSGWQINAGYRSYSYQKQLFENAVQDYMDQGFSRSKAESATRQTVADPGTSEHHTGLAFDITVENASQFKGTDQQKWLHKHCWDYGFIIRYQEDKEKITGYIAECWHIRYVGLPHSQTMYDRNLCLEEYLGITD